MIDMTSKAKFVIGGSFLIGLILQAIPWPGALEALRPSWMILIGSYWVLALPYRVNIGIMLFLGLCWDLIIGTTLGVHGVVMSVTGYIVALNCQVLRNMALWQQAVVIGLITVLGECLEFFSEYILLGAKFDPSVLWGGLINCILWPWMFLLLRKVRRHWNMR